MSAAAVHQFPVVRAYMTTSPRTVPQTASLSTAHRIMQDGHIRHLPVLDGERIVGVISERDLLLAETLPGVNPTVVHVGEIMIADVFSVPPNAPIGEVIEDMLARKLGSAVVCADGRVVGVFTTIDALRALHERLERP